MKHPEAIGMAMIEFDCGCVVFCGVSAKGNPIGDMTSASGQPAGEDTVCLRCYRDKKIDWKRVTAKRLIWPGEESEKPEASLRMAIGRTVFGPDYRE